MQRTSMIISKLVDGTWTSHTFTGMNVGAAHEDNAGNIYVSDDWGGQVGYQRGPIYRVAPSGDALEPIFDCTNGMTMPYCKGTATLFRSDSAGNLTFVRRTDIEPAVAGMYRLPAGSTTPKKIVSWPLRDDPDLPIIFSLDYDRDGNYYLVYGSNITLEADLYVLSSGSTTFARRTAWVPATNSTYIMDLGPGGTVYAVNGFGPYWLLR